MSLGLKWFKFFDLEWKGECKPLNIEDLEDLEDLEDDDVPVLFFVFVLEADVVEEALLE